MPGPARRYLGLTDDVHPSCLDKLSPWFRPQPILVSQPYENLDEIAFEVPGIIGAGESAAVLSLVMPMSDSLVDRGPGTLGWYSEEEMALLDRISKHIDEVRSEVYGTGGNDNNKFQAMIDDARDQHDLIASIYHQFDNQTQYVTPGWGVVRAPLDRSYSSFRDQLSESHYDTGQLDGHGNKLGYLEQQRVDAREEVRKAWDHMLSVLWCSEVWLAATESYYANRELWFERKNNIGSGLTMAPTTGQSNTSGRTSTNVTNTSPIRATRSGDDGGESNSGGMLLLVMSAGVALLLSRGK